MKYLLLIIGIAFIGVAHLFLPLCLRKKATHLTTPKLWLISFMGGLVGFAACSLISKSFFGISGIIISAFCIVIAFLILDRGKLKRKTFSDKRYCINQTKGYCILPADTPEEAAIEIANAKWECLTDKEKDLCKEFYLAYGEYYADDFVDLNTAQIILTIK